MRWNRHRAGQAADAAEAAGRSRLLWRPDTGVPAKRHVMGLAIDNITLPEAIAATLDAAEGPAQSRAVFVNAHVVNSAWADAAYWRTVVTADRRYADGSGLAIAARLAGTALVDNVNGTDMLPLLAAAAVRRGVSIYLLGGAPGTAAASAAGLSARGLGMSIAGTHHGYILDNPGAEAAAIADINASGARVLLVGMGVPLQDQWIERNAHRLAPRVLIGVGGLFDFYSGRVSRAPAALRSCGLEWVWRLAQEPRRMWRRYLVGNATFLVRAAREALRARRCAAISTAVPKTTASRRSAPAV